MTDIPVISVLLAEIIAEEIYVTRVLLEDIPPLSVDKTIVIGAEISILVDIIIANNNSKGRDNGDIHGSDKRVIEDVIAVLIAITTEMCQI